MQLTFQTTPLAPDEPVLHVALVGPDDALADVVPFPTVDAQRLLAEARRVGFRGKEGQEVVLSGDQPGTRFALVGTGDVTRPGQWRVLGSRLMALAGRFRLPALQIATSLEPGATASLVEGLHLTAWTFSAYKQPAPEEEQALRLRTVVLPASPEMEAVLEEARSLGESVCYARNLANEPPNVCSPTWLAEQAVEMATRLGLESTVYDHDAIRARGFRLLDAVGRGSSRPPCMIHLTWRPSGTPTRRVALVGKGLTFDSGGYSLKPPASQIDMHLDMGGAVAVLGAAHAIGMLKPDDIEVHFIVPAAENMVSGEAYRVMDIIKAYNGLHVEVHNTDAEGRLVLADALAYAAELPVDAIVDCATLTGSCVMALGMETAGLFSDHEPLVQELLQAATSADELLWRLPLVERMKPQIDSSVADLKNIGGRWGGAITAALFLQRFVGDKPWAHIDLAGPAMADSAWEYIPKGGTGYGVLLLAHWLRQQAERPAAA